ncbi:Exonuclease V [Neolecta irregularis DAH-3]|uniref:Exonuclease V n=1 Tax=Neolecta irregularis (strain DAH-3) TaxID=1198029 RepID=A0A1U7LJU9_NEOID|nr:Exonuclease V [Neolecta irregularis DAH-3]|eukprot:OLL22801.1 Exonuclease V [Neolecta irregularis DAH-3]
MLKGQKVHATLELELHETKPVAHATSTEDRWALRFINILFAISELETHQKTRELTVFGFINDTFVLGIIDEISISAQTSQTILLSIADYKTRVNPTLPSKFQLKQTSFQLMLYKQLLQDLVSATFDFVKFSNIVRVDPDKCLTLPFIMEMAETGILCLDILLENNTLRKLWEYTLRKKLARYSVNQELFVHYIHQTDSSCFASQSIKFDPVQLEMLANDSLGWWTGKRPPTGVDIEESFKCSHCVFAEKCSWRLSKIEESTQRHRVLRESMKFPKR